MPAVQFCQDAPHTPHVHSRAVGEVLQHDLWCAVAQGPHAHILLVLLEAAGPEVNDLQGQSVWGLQQDVLRLQVAVHDALRLKEMKRKEQLNCQLVDNFQVQPLVNGIPLCHLSPCQPQLTPKSAQHVELIVWGRLPLTNSEYPEKVTHYTISYFENDGRFRMYKTSVEHSNLHEPGSLMPSFPGVTARLEIEGILT